MSSERDFALVCDAGPILNQHRWNVSRVLGCVNKNHTIRIIVAGGNVKVGGGRYLIGAHAKRHSRYNAARPQRFGGRVQVGGSKPPTCGEFFQILDALRYILVHI